MNLKMLTKTVSVALQMQPGDMEKLAAQGIRSVVCNRPDGEGADQPTFAEVEEACRRHGLTSAAALTRLKS